MHQNVKWSLYQLQIPYQFDYTLHNQQLQSTKSKKAPEHNHPFWTQVELPGGKHNWQSDMQSSPTKPAGGRSEVELPGGKRTWQGDMQSRPTKPAGERCEDQGEGLHVLGAPKWNLLGLFGIHTQRLIRCIFSMCKIIRS